MSWSSEEVMTLQRQQEFVVNAGHCQDQLSDNEERI
jgi:hypothetical protein